MSDTKARQRRETEDDVHGARTPQQLLTGRLSSGSGRYAFGPAVDSKNDQRAGVQQQPRPAKAGNVVNSRSHLRSSVACDSMPSMMRKDTKERERSLQTDTSPAAKQLEFPPTPSPVQEGPDLETLHRAQADLVAAEQEVQALKAEKADLQMQLDACNQSIKYMQSTNDATTSTSEIYQLMFRKELMEHMSRSEELNRQVSEQSERLNDTASERAALEARLQRVAEDAAQQAQLAQKALDMAKEREAALEAMLPRYKSAAIEAELNTDHLKVDLQTLQDAMVCVRRELEVAQGEAMAAQSDALCKAAQIQGLQAEYERRVNEFESQQALLQQRLTEQQAEADARLEKATAAHTSALQEVMQQLQASEAARNTQAARLTAVERQQTELTAQHAKTLSEAQADIVALRRTAAQAGALKAKVESVEAAGEALRVERDKAQTEAGLLLARRELLQTQLKEAHAARSKLQQQDVELQASLADRMLAVERLNLRLQEQQQRAAQLSVQEARAQEQLLAARREVEELSNIVGEKMTEVAELTVDKVRLVEQLAAARAAPATAA